MNDNLNERSIQNALREHAENPLQTYVVCIKAL